MRLALALAALLLVSPAVAASPEGAFRRRGAYPLGATVFALDSAEHFVGRFTTGHPDDANHCGGTFTATGHREQENRLVFSGKPEDGRACRVTMTFNRSFDQALIEEDGCTFYHGASCAFDGTVLRDSR